VLLTIRYMYSARNHNVPHAQSSTPAGRGRDRLSIALAAVGCALAIAACGASGKPSNTGGHNVFLAFSACMRSHGVSNFPDPSPGGGIQLSSGMNPSAPSFKAAQASCRKLLPGGGPGARHPSAQARAETLKMSACMRQHGVAGFPDPTLSLPSNSAGYSQISDRGGVILAIPDTINTQSPAFKQATAACGGPAGVGPR
jgi:hypothetical protein